VSKANAGSYIPTLQANSFVREQLAKAADEVLLIMQKKTLTAYLMKRMFGGNWEYRRRQKKEAVAAVAAV
jgi:hypothetical protein